MYSGLYVCVDLLCEFYCVRHSVVVRPYKNSPLTIMASCCIAALPVLPFPRKTPQISTAATSSMAATPSARCTPTLASSVDDSLTVDDLDEWTLWNDCSHWI